MIATIPLAHGLRIDGQSWRTCELRPLDGHDEEALAGLPGDMPAARRVSELLARTIVRMGALDRPGVELVGDLAVGDRERLLLNLFAITFEPRVTVNLRCAACAEDLDASLAIADLICSDDPPPQPDYRVSAGRQSIRIRVPRGSDQEAVTALAADDLDRACDALVRRCLIDAPPGLDLGAWREAIETRFAELDPQAETSVRLMCPSCEAGTDWLLDAAALIFDRMATASQLIDEVHAIASQYHWSERAILALSTPRRRTYLDRIGTGSRF